MTSVAVVSTTVGSEKEARALGSALVEARLAACVQILPIASVYRWEGEIRHAAEHLLLCKISSGDFDAVEAAILDRHTYNVPEIVMTPITWGHTPYLEWISEATTRPNQSGGTL